MTAQSYKKASYVALGASIVFGLLAIVSAYATTIHAQDTNTTVNVSQNTTVVVPTPAPVEPADAVLFYITDDRETAAAGDTLTYRIVVRNHRNDDINQIRVTARIPDYLVPLATSPASEANSDERTLVWNDISLSARAEQTYAIRAQIAPETAAATTLRIVAEINGPGVRGGFTDSTVVEAKPGRIDEQAATTTAPTPPPTPVRPTAPTGSTGLYSALVSVLGSIALGWYALRFAHAS